MSLITSIRPRNMKKETDLACIMISIDDNLDFLSSVGACIFHKINIKNIGWETLARINSLPQQAT